MVLQRPGLIKEKKHRSHKAEVANAIYDKGLLAGGGSGRAFKPETDEQIRARPDAFPPEEHQHKVVRQHEHEHGEHEQVQIREEEGEPWVTVHVPDGEHVDQRGDPGHKQHHRHRKRIRQKRHIHTDRRQPRPEDLGIRPLLRSFGGEVSEDPEGNEERAANHGRGQPTSNGFADALAAQQQDGKPE